ncbi:MAG: hypothetical protein NTW97_05675 [Candidatus Krumholzibacteria bacterium]|nr:hypothetical protein [Candidatus Krumholzibacteria bacterium]
MNLEEISRLLDNLDRRLALGEIDLATYNQLKAKFSAQASSAGNPLDALAAAAPKVAQALKCPGCMAPLPAPSDASQTSVLCEYCGGTFTLQTAADEMERLRSEVRKWIAEIAGGVAGGTTVDEASRRFIFNDKLLPSLATATNRASELFGLTRYQPFFSFPLIDKLPSSQFHQALQLTPDLNFVVDKIKGAVARIQAPETLAFAVGEKEKAALLALELQCEENVFLSNSRRHLSAYTPEGIQKARTNFKALADLYESASRASLALDPSYAKFSAAMAKRTNAVEQAIGVLGRFLGDSEGGFTSRSITDLEVSAQKCDEAIAEIESAGREPKEQVPAVEGTRVDADTIRILGNCIRLFELCGAETGESFTQFLLALGESVDYAKEPSSDLNWLSDFFSRIVTHIGAVAEESAVPVINDFNWAEGKVPTLIRKSFLGSAETAEITKKVLVPFWVATLTFSQQKGVIFKKGQALDGLLLIDASRHNGSCSVVKPEDLLYARCQDAINSPKSIGRSPSAVVPVVSADRAQQAIKSFTSHTQGYIGSYANLQSVVYIPAAVARFSTKKAERHEVMFPSDMIQGRPFEIKPIRLGNREVLFLR